MISWVAHYNDGTEAHQSEGISYADLDRSNLQAFDLWQNGRLLVRVDLRQDDVSEGVEPRRLIYRRRVWANSNGEEMVFYLIGWQRRVKGVKVQAVNYVFEHDGSVLLGGQFTNRDFMDEIYILPHEEDLR